MIRQAAHWCILLVGVGAVTMAHADTTVIGTRGAITIDDTIEIPAGATATLNGTIVKGDVKVYRNASFTANGARIEGNVQADLESPSALFVKLDLNTRVDGDVQGKYTRTVIVQGGTVVGGNVQVTEAVAPSTVDALLVTNATVDGDVQAEKSSGRLRAVGNRIGGNLQFVENRTGLYDIRNNTIGGDLQFFKNIGSGTITGNTVEGNLQSKENSPPPVISGNTVYGSTEIDAMAPLPGTPAGSGTTLPGMLPLLLDK